MHSPAQGTARHLLTIALVAVVVSSSLLHAWAYARALQGLDYYQFWAVAQAATQGHGEDAYSPEGRRRMGAAFEARAEASSSDRWRGVARARWTFDTYSTPFLYTVVASGVSGEYDRDYLTFQAVSLLTYALAIGLLCRCLGFSIVEGGLILAYAVTAFEPFLSDQRVGNVARLQTAGLALAMVLLSRRRAGWDAGAGALLGLSTAFKPNMAVSTAAVILGLLFARAPRRSLAVAIGASVGMLAAVLASAARFGRIDLWASWMRALLDLPPGVVRMDQGNYAPLALLGTSRAMAAAVPLTLLLVVALSRAARSVPPSAEPGAHLAALGALVGLMTGPLTWLHYYMLALPALLDLLAPERLTKPRLTLGVLFLSAYAAKYGLGSWAEQPIAWIVFAAGATAGLLAAGVHALRSRP